MHASINQSLWTQFGASIDMLENAINFCPAEQWDTDTKFWYNAYHTLFFLDYYLTMEPVNFAPPAPFTDAEFGDDIPERTYTKEELLSYLQACRKKCHKLIAGLTEEQLNSRWINVSRTMDYAVLEIILYNLRHVQHHAAQLNLLLRQGINDAPKWVARTKQVLL
jgi:hypothetical protein